MEALSICSIEGQPKDISSTTLMDGFISAQDVKESSRNTYRKALRVFLEWLRSEGIENPTRQDILVYKRLLVGLGLSPFTVSQYMVVVRKFFEYLESTLGYQNVAKGVKGTKRPKGFRKDALTVEQIRSPLSSIDRSTIQGKRDYAIINLMLRTGLRTIEIINADIGDIRQQSGETVLFIYGKGRDSKDEFVVLTQEALQPIYEYLQARGRVRDGDPLFVSESDRNKNQRLTTRSISRIVKEHLRGIHLDCSRVTAHSLRHTFATVALMNGAPLIQVKEAMRHSSIDTTMVYAHSLDRIANGAERYINFQQQEVRHADKDL